MTAIAVAWVWLYHGVSQQEKNLALLKVVLGAGLTLSLWLLAWSRTPWRLRLAIFGAVVVLIGVVAVTVEIRGVTGDLLPVLEWRWNRRTLARPHISRPPSPPGTLVTGRGYPQFLGPNRSGVLDGPALGRDWQAQPPIQLWRQPVGAAWSGFAIAGPYAVTQEQRNGEELVVCYELFTGRALWSHSDTVRYFTTIAGEGPRATPTIASNRVFALGATGVLNCLDLTTGKRLWSKNITADNKSKMGDWGVAGSPLIVKDMVVVHAGGKQDRSLVAYDARTGEFVWGAGQDSMDYSSPTLARFAGVEQILIFNPTGVAAHDAITGKILWRHGWPGKHPHVTVPIALPEDRLLISSGYGTGAELVKITKADTWAATRLWKSNRLKSKFANLIFYDGYIYGLDDGILVCLDLVDGSLKWKEGRYGHGQMILVDDVILVMTEQGDVVLIEPSFLGHRELTRMSAFNGKTWNPPALAGDLLLVRNDKEAACYRLPLRESKSHEAGGR